MNEEAAKLFAENKKQFAEKVNDCVNESVNNVFLSRGPNNKNFEFSSLVFSKWNDEMDKHYNSILNKDEQNKKIQDKTEEKKKGILSFLGFEK